MLIFLYVTAIWNGASYYIEVFSTRYNRQFADMPAGADPDAPPPLPPRVATERSEHDAGAAADDEGSDVDDEGPRPRDKAD